LPLGGRFAAALLASPCNGAENERSINQLRAVERGDSNFGRPTIRTRLLLEATGKAAFKSRSRRCRSIQSDLRSEPPEFLPLDICSGPD
jgi:hypothetical protein